MTSLDAAKQIVDYLNANWTTATYGSVSFNYDGADVNASMIQFSQLSDSHVARARVLIIMKHTVRLAITHALDLIRNSGLYPVMNARCVNSYVLINDHYSQIEVDIIQ